MAATLTGQLICGHCGGDLVRIVPDAESPALGYCESCSTELYVCDCASCTDQQFTWVDFDAYEQHLAQQAAESSLESPRPRRRSQNPRYSTSPVLPTRAIRTPVNKTRPTPPSSVSPRSTPGSSRSTPSKSRAGRKPRIIDDHEEVVNSDDDDNAGGTFESELATISFSNPLSQEVIQRSRRYIIMKESDLYATHHSVKDSMAEGIRDQLIAIRSQHSTGV